MDIERYHIYKVFNDGAYLGLLPNVTSDFSYSQEINTAAAQTVVTIDQSLDNAEDELPYIVTEDGTIITTENNIPLTVERATVPVGGKDSGALIANYNDIEIWEISSDNPNGVLVFEGYISKWKADAGGNDSISITVVSNGLDLDDYIYGNQTNTLIVSQTTGDPATFYNTLRYGQTFITGGSQTDISQITLKLYAASGGPRTFTLRLWNSPSQAVIGGTPLGSVSVVVSSAVGADVVFSFGTSVPVSANTQYFFSLEVDSGSVYANPATYGAFYCNTTTNPYANGTMYQSGSGGPWSTLSANFDFYFKIYSGTILTDATFTTVDPSAIVTQSLDGYQAQGGLVVYSGASIDACGYTVSYSFKLATLLEIIKKATELAPSDWFWFVDPATRLLYFKQTETTATHKMILGKHLENLEIEATVEDIANVIYFSGGPTAGVNLLKRYSDAASIALNRIGMKRLNDNRVTSSTTAQLLSQAYIDENSEEVFRGTITINANTYDIASIMLGDTFGFAGFGNFIDNLILQATRIQRNTDDITITLGRLPLRSDAYVDSIRRDLENQQTLANPTAPS